LRQFAQLIEIIAAVDDARVDHGGRLRGQERRYALGVEKVNQRS
jgi:hypothetical protein